MSCIHTQLRTLGIFLADFILPRYLEKDNLFKAFEDFAATNPELPKDVLIDFSNVRFITPPSVAFLSNLSHWFCCVGTKVEFTGLDVTRQPIKYLDDSLFFEQHLGEKLHPSSSCRSTTVPVRQIDKTHSHAWLEYEFLPWLMAKSGLNKSSLAEVKTCLQEIFNNISDHTQFEAGCIFAQWYPNKSQIIITIADFGIGIPENVKKVAGSLTDNEAIIKAAEDGFSTKSLPTNRGAGLYLLLLNIVQRFHGTVTIRSGRGYVEFENLHGSIYTYPKNNCGFCLGTTIDIVLRTELIPLAEDEEDFEWNW